MTPVITAQSRVIAKILENIVSVQLSGYLESNICFTLIRVLVNQ